MSGGVGQTASALLGRLVPNRKHGKVVPMRGWGQGLNFLQSATNHTDPMVATNARTILAIHDRYANALPDEIERRAGVTFADFIANGVYDTNPFPRLAYTNTLLQPDGTIIDIAESDAALNMTGNVFDHKRTRPLGEWLTKVAADAENEKQAVWLRIPEDLADLYEELTTTGVKLSRLKGVVELLDMAAKDERLWMLDIPTELYENARDALEEQDADTFAQHLEEAVRRMWKAQTRHGVDELPAWSQHAARAIAFGKQDGTLGLQISLSQHFKPNYFPKTDPSYADMTDTERERAMLGLLLHEYGHAVSMANTPESNEWRESLGPVIRQQHAQAVQNGTTVSEYAKDNPVEFYAETFSCHWVGMLTADDALQAKAWQYDTITNHPNTAA